MFRTPSSPLSLRLNIKPVQLRWHDSSLQQDIRGDPPTSSVDFFCQECYRANAHHPVTFEILHMPQGEYSTSSMNLSTLLTRVFLVAIDGKRDNLRRNLRHDLVIPSQFPTARRDLPLFSNFTGKEETLTEKENHVHSTHAQYIQVKQEHAPPYLALSVFLRLLYCHLLQLRKHPALQAHLSKYPILLSNQIQWRVELGDGALV